MTPLHLACKNGHTEIVDCIFSQGCVPDAQDHVSRDDIKNSREVGSVHATILRLCDWIDKNCPDFTK